MSSSLIKVWDPFVRLFHWSLVTCFFVAYLSGDDDNPIHIFFGYAVIALVLARLIWGFVGTKYARFGQFAYSFKRMLGYLKEFVAGRPKHYTGHNPAAAWMIFALLFCLILTSASGLKLYGIEGKGPLASSTGDPAFLKTDFSLIRSAYAKDYDKKFRRDFYRNRGGKGHDLWEDVHEFFAQLTLLLVFVHVAGAVAASVVHRENLIKAMITGVKQQHSGDRAD